MPNLRSPPPDPQTPEAAAPTEVAPRKPPGLALWHGRKFHVRCYAVLTGDLGVFVQRRAFLHVANKPFRADGASHADDQVVESNSPSKKA